MCVRVRSLCYFISGSDIPAYRVSDIPDYRDSFLYQVYAAAYFRQHSFCDA